MPENPFADLIPGHKASASAPSAVANRRQQMQATGESIESADVDQAKGRTSLAVDVPTVPAQITSRRAGAVKDAVEAGVAKARADLGIEGAQADEKTSAYNLGRLEDNQVLIKGMLRKYPKAGRPNALAEISGKLPIVGDMIENKLNSPERQQVVAEQLDMLDAALYLATGAAYNKEQLKNLSKSYFPQIADDDKTIASKQLRMDNLIRRAKVRAGTVGTPIAPLGGSGPNVSPTATGPSGKPVLSPPLPPAIAAQLKEGIHSHFDTPSGRQTWTKKNGVPVRVE